MVNGWGWIYGYQLLCIKWLFGSFCGWGFGIEPDDREKTKHVKENGPARGRSRAGQGRISSATTTYEKGPGA